MSVRPYLPSTKFIVMAGSILLSAGLVVWAESTTRPQPIATIQSDTTASAGQWQQALQDVESQSNVSAPQPPSQDTVNSLLSAAQSDNLTTSVGRTLLVNLSSAKSQGLGDDVPTQDQIIAQATAQINASSTPPAYTAGDLITVPQTAASLRAYGNAVMTILNAHPAASAQDTYVAVGNAVDSQNAASLATLAHIGSDYAAIAKDLAHTPVPQPLSPLHLQILNDYAAAAGVYADMGAVLTDPLRGLAAVQRYNALTDEMRRVFINIGQTLNKDGILFTKDEPGSAWSAFTSS